MNQEQLQKQAERVEGFVEGYKACLNWVRAQIEQEQREAAAAMEKVAAEQKHESVPQA